MTAPKPRDFLRKALIALAVALGFWTLVLMLFEDRFIYFPRPFPEGPYGDAQFIPHLEEFTLLTEDGVRLHAWYAPADTPIAVVLISHGNGGNLSYGIEHMRRLQLAGLSVFAYDYRGYGKSEGTPSEEGVVLDAVAAYDHLTGPLGVSAQKVILWGTSLGGAVTVQLASRRPSAGLILESTFTSARDVAARVYPFLPVRWFMRASFDAAGTLRTLPCPSLHIHGEQDEIIDLDLGKALYDAAPGPKEWYVIPGCGHNDTYLLGGAEYVGRAVDFARACVQR
ncbi:MAG: alpha/beta hydrolase [Bacteroidota bacterium]